jgi:branched-chain amino acid transport system ATP-binding protein
MFPPLKEKRKQPAGTLSGGQRQMVAMGKALMLEPVILMLDEPSAGLSPKYRSEIFTIIKDINGTGTPILMVEQNAREALRISSRGYILVDGRNRIDGPGPELLANKDVARMFLGAGGDDAS